MRDAGEMDDMGDAVEQRLPIGALGKIRHSYALDAACSGNRRRITGRSPDLPSGLGENRGQMLADKA